MDTDFGEQSPLLGMVQQIVFNDNLLHKLKATDVVINALDEETKKRTNANAFQKYIHSLFGDEEFMRRFTYIASIKSNIETALEYYGQDYLSGQDFEYDAYMEKRLLSVEKKLSNFLGGLLKELSKGFELEID